MARGLSMSNIYEEGKRAYYEKKTEEDCPYLGETKLAWIAGYTDAKSKEENDERKNYWD